VRLQLELLKPELELDERGIKSTIVLFGGARMPEPGDGLGGQERNAARKSQPPLLRRSAEIRPRCDRNALVTTNCTENVIVTGGGPGVMEAGNLGAPRRRSVDRPQHRAAARAGAERIRDAGALLQLPLFRASARCTS
jgi:predicted Rossmann-fold nucleotide-binding protein